MDNLCHTLAGLAIGEAVLTRRSALTTATLIIGANLPDVDVLAYIDSPVAALGFRRGWTHGVLAMAVWPFVLTAVMGGFRKAGPPRGRPLLLLSVLSVWSHPLLDWMNTYGVRFLMPFSGRWFYGDTLFIIDPWVWSALLLGVIASRKWPLTPARAALAAVMLYIAVMFGWTIVKENAARSNAVSDAGLMPLDVMAAPLFARPLARDVLVETDSFYIRSAFRIPKLGGAEAGRAATTAQGRTFLVWSRFPYSVTGPADGCPAGHVCFRDARYPGQDWAEARIPLTR